MASSDISAATSARPFSRFRRPGRISRLFSLIAGAGSLTLFCLLFPSPLPAQDAPARDAPALPPPGPVPARTAAPVQAQPLPGVSPPQATPVPEDILSYADLLYSKEQYAIAAQQYQIFIREQPTSPNLQAAWFRLGECYLKVNQLEDSLTTF